MNKYKIPIDKEFWDEVFGPCDYCKTEMKKRVREIFGREERKWYIL